METFSNAIERRATCRSNTAHTCARPKAPYSYVVALVLVVAASLFSASAQTNLLYTNDFEKAEIGKVPEDFPVFDGAFAVRESNGNKYLELPGAPLDNFWAQLGPADGTNIAVFARIAGTSKGRRFPTFGIGLNGVAGYKLQVSPAKGMLELYRDQELAASVPFEWKSGSWTHLRLQLRKLDSGSWKIEGKAWTEGTAEPGNWLVTFDEKKEPVTGRPSLFGSPYSGTPIQFDDLAITKASSR